MGMRLGLRIIAALSVAAAVSVLPVFERMIVVRGDGAVVYSGSFWETRAAAADGAEVDLLRDLAVLAAVFAMGFEISGWRRMAHGARLFFVPVVLCSALAFAIAFRGAPSAGMLLLLIMVVGLVRRLLYLPSANRRARPHRASAGQSS